MFTAMAIMFLGLGLGFLARGRAWPGLVTRCVTPAIMLLLFALGVSVGSNAALMEALPRLGGAALLLTLAGVAGSMVCVACIRRYFRQAPGPAALRFPQGKAGAAAGAKPLSPETRA